MIIYIGADHRGYDLKESVKKYLQSVGYDVMDEGDMRKDESDNYPDFARKVAERIGEDSANRRGILLCGSGAGMCIAANKFRGARASMAMTPDQAAAIKAEDDVNILCLASDFLDEDMAKKIVSIWMQTPFDEKDPHRERIEQVRQIEVDLGLWK